MKPKFLIALQEKISKNSDEPWACFETAGPGDDGLLAFSISYNKAFIKRLHKFGFQGINDEETVQLFFLSVRMMPNDLYEEDVVNPEATPTLTSEANTLKR